MVYGIKVFSMWYIVHWVAVKELKLSYQNPETISFIIYPYGGN